MWIRTAILGASALGLAAVNAATPEEPAVLAKAVEVSANDSAVRFVPSEDAQLETVSFEDGFEPYGDTPAVVPVPENAVDIASFEPPVEAEPQGIRSLGSGVASYYGRGFDGRRTANGETFNSRELTAAHKTLPFGTRVRVTNPRNGKSVVVRINDRGPFVRGRHIDLSRSAADQIGIVSAGHATVELEIVE